jgi:hypothetical protein
VDQATDNPTVREVARFVVAFAGGAVGTDRIVAAAKAWRQWHRWIRADPSAADLFKTNCWIFSIEAALAITFAALVYSLLRGQGSTKAL